MSFLSPERLWLLLAVAVLAGVYVAFSLSRKKYAVRFTNTQLLDSVAPRRPGWRRHIPAALFLAAIAALVVGFAQPTADVRVPRERATIVMAIDTSISMGAEDVAPSRLAAAQEAAKRFADELPDKINVGLVTFDRSASVVVPPTTDRVQLDTAIDRLELDQYTATGDAIIESLEAIQTVPVDDEGTMAPARIVLMSDGERTTGATEEEAAQAANDAEVPVSTISFGTEYGTIPSPEDGSTLSVAVNPVALQSIAEATGGTFFEAATGEELNQVYEDIGSSVGFETEAREVTIWFVGAALALMLATAAFSLAWFARLP